MVLFFLISGFVIPFSLKGDKAIRRFAISRLFRLYPAYWLTIVILAAVTLLLYGRAYPLAQIAANLTMAPSLFGQNYISGVFWTLFIELAFYFACAALFALRQLRNGEVILLVGLGCIGAPIAGIAARTVGIPAPVLYLGAHLSFLFAGYLIRMAVLDEHPRAKLYAAILTGCALAAMPLLAAQPDHQFTISTPAGVTLAGAAAVATFVFVNLRCPEPGQALIWLGTISYSIYLLHLPVGELVRSAIAPKGMAGAAAFMLLAIALTCPVIAGLQTGGSAGDRDGTSLYTRATGGAGCGNRALINLRS